MSNPPIRRPATLDDLARFWPEKTREELAAAAKAIAAAGGEITISSEPPQFVCPVCNAASWHPADRRWGYCGRCHDYTGLPDSSVDYPPGGGDE